MVRRALPVLSLLLACTGDIPVGAEPFPCFSPIVWPEDGASNIPVDAKVQLGPDLGCPSNPTFVRDDGAPVRFTTQAESGALQLLPETPLESGRRYTVDLGTGTSSCGAPGDRVTFRVGPAPSLRRVDLEIESAPRWHGSLTIVRSVVLSFSEGVADATKLSARTGGPITLEAGGGEIESEEQKPTLLRVTFAPDTAPRLSDRLTVRVADDLAFASGARWEGPAEVSFVPEESAGWASDPASINPCEFGSDCASVRPGALALLLLLVLRRRR